MPTLDLAERYTARRLRTPAVEKTTAAQIAVEDTGEVPGGEPGNRRFVASSCRNQLAHEAGWESQGNRVKRFAVFLQGGTESLFVLAVVTYFKLQQQRRAQAVGVLEQYTGGPDGKQSAIRLEQALASNSRSAKVVRISSVRLTATRSAATGCALGV